MTWANIKLILGREIRDQMRDRRTLFMIFVLPLLLYPVLGIGFFQVSQFISEKPTSVLVVGARQLDGFPRLLENEQFAPELFLDGKRARLLEVEYARTEPRPDGTKPIDSREAAVAAVEAGHYDAALYFPLGFDENMELFRESLRSRGRGSGSSDDMALEERADETSTGGGSDAATSGPLTVPSPEIIHSTAREKSRIAYQRLAPVLMRWSERVGEDNLAVGGLPTVTTRPFSLQSADVARESKMKGASRWSKILPMLLVLWAMTGAFYPAVDLCAGEKERGTLETLLSSPASRTEIVLGKLMTVMLFSSATAVLNLLSVGLTGWTVLRQFDGFGVPPWSAILWLAVALVPVAALFSALCLALAAFARSTKEGQYYLMPLMLVTMPLCILPMAPGVELNLGQALIPVTGIVLLLKTMLEGHYWTALEYLAPVVAVTGVCCTLAVRWAVEQFNSESVLFAESEQLNVRLWLRRAWRERQATPGVSAAVCCAALILIMRFFVTFAGSSSEQFWTFARSAVATQVLVIALPAVVLALLLTRSPRKTLMLTGTRWLAVPNAMLLAAMLYPALNVLQRVVVALYPVSDDMAEALLPVQRMFTTAPVWALLLVIAVMPAVCEELAFRGFILSGLRRATGKWRAIVITAILFGIAHGVLQQSLIASLVGVVIGYVAVQSGSLLPAIAFHVVNNSLVVLGSRITPEVLDRWPLLAALVSGNPAEGYLFHWQLIVVGLVAAWLILTWFSRLTSAVTLDAQIRAALRRRLREEEREAASCQSSAAGGP